MTNKGGKGFNKNFRGSISRPQGSFVPKTPQKPNEVESVNSKSSENLKLGFVDLTEIPQSVLKESVRFLDKWGIREKDYSLVGVLVKSLNPIIFSPLIILNGDSEVIVLREAPLSAELEKATGIRSTKILPSEIYKSNGSVALVKRSFVSNTLGDVFKMSGGFSLDRLVNLLYSTIDSISDLHRKGIAHGNINEWNVSAGIENQGYLLDVGLVKSNATIAEDQLALSKLLERAISKVRVKKEELEDKKKLQGILAPLLESLSEKNESRRPTIEVSRGLFKDLVDIVLGDPINPDIVARPLADPIKDINLISDSSQDLPYEEVVFTKLNNKLNVEKDVSTPIHSEEKAQMLNFSPVEEVTKKKNNLFRYLVYSTLIVLVCYFSFKVFQKISGLSLFSQSEGAFDGPLLGLEDLQVSWNSGVPSKMRQVARQAIYDSSLRDLAEEVIISPILLDQNVAKLVDASLIRVAFAKEWEAQLSPQDRRFILSLALREILKDEFPSDLPTLSDLHPAILLSVLSGTDFRVPAILNSVSASMLESLPEPFGVAYQILLSGKPELKASSEEVVALAHIGTRGVNDPVLLSNFLKVDFERRLSALAVMFSVNGTESLKVLDTILNHPNVALNNPATEWAKKIDLLSWDGVEASDKLFLTAGVALRPDKVLAAEQIARLFLNPSPRVRGYAVGLSIHQIPFKHKGAIDVLTLIQKVPDVVSSLQLTLLAQILEDPDRTVDTHMKVVKNFIASEPPMDIAKTLLLANSKSTAQNILDGSLSAYLSERGWVPDQAEIEILVGHHDKVARMYGYQRLFQLSDKVKALEMLKKCYEVETEITFKDQLKLMIEQLEGTKG